MRQQLADSLSKGEAALQGHAPRSLEEVDLFAPGAQEHWYAAYAILHAEAPGSVSAGRGADAG